MSFLSIRGGPVQWECAKGFDTVGISHNVWIFSEKVPWDFELTGSLEWHWLAAELCGLHHLISEKLSSRIVLTAILEGGGRALLET